MPQFPGSISDAHADVIVGQLLKWCISPHASMREQVKGLSTVACVVCDAVSEDITLQPLHDAYGRAKKHYESVVTALHESTRKQNF